MTAHHLATGYLGLLLAERLVELAVSTRNARAMLARGGVERGRGHYPAMVAFHVLFLAGCAAEPLVSPLRLPPAVAAAALLAALLAQALRWWAVASLRGRWTTRVIVVPGEPLEAGGPYRFARHPNYAAVALELAAVPLALSAPFTAALATLGNALLMAVRIPAEERALGLAAPAPAARAGGAA